MLGRAAGLVLFFSAWLGVVQCARNPIILLPGLAGSVLEEQLNRTSAKAWYCDLQSDWKVLWLSLTAAARPDCLLDDLQIIYDEQTGLYRNQTGVQVRPYKYGSTAGVAALDPDLVQATATYDQLINGLQKAGWDIGKDLFGAPYDFRLAADGLQQTGAMDQLKGLIETSVKGNEGQPAVLIAHSMGNLVALWLMYHQTAGWLSANVAGFVSISAPFLGSVTALKGSISGDNFDAPFIPHDLLRPLQSTAPSGVWLFPDTELWGDTVLVETQGPKYRAKDALQMLQDLNLTQQAAVLPKVSQLTKPLKPLSVPVFCIYGTGLPTENAFFYNTPHFSAHTPNAPANVSHGDGDGTVNIESLQACEQLGQQVQVKTFPGSSHLGLLREDKVVQHIVGLLTQSSLQQRLRSLGSRVTQFMQLN